MLGGAQGSTGYRRECVGILQREWAGGQLGLLAQARCGAVHTHRISVGVDPASDDIGLVHGAPEAHTNIGRAGGTHGDLD